MTNEALQWLVIGCVVFLLFGVLRRISLNLPPPERAAPSGPPVGMLLPRGTARRVQAVADHETLAGRILAFVTENCTGCQRLLSDLESGSQSTKDVVIIARNPSSEFAEAIRALGVPHVFDPDGSVWGECHVTATPLLVRLGVDGVADAKEVTHRVDKIRLTEAEPSSGTAGTPATKGSS